MRIFTRHQIANFVSRPHRFAVFAEDPVSREIFQAHCPNPGALREFLIPGTPLIFEHSENPKRKLAHTLVGIEYKGSVVPLFSARANQAAAQLVLPQLFPGGQIRPEYTPPELEGGKSRFDFLVTTKDGEKTLVEVKACSLVEYGVAMFPDAPSSRASRHLEELSQLTKQGYRARSIFIISHGHPRFFIPHIHSDLTFTQVLVELGEPTGPIQITASSISCSKEGEAQLEQLEIPMLRPHPSLLQNPEGCLIAFLSQDNPHGYSVVVVPIGRDLPRAEARLKRITRCKTMVVYGRNGLAQGVISALAGCAAWVGTELIRDFHGLGEATCFKWQLHGLHDRELLDILFYFRHQRFAEVECVP